MGVIDFIVDLQTSRDERQARKPIKASLDVGTVMGHLKVLEVEKLSTSGVITYHCGCECGNEIVLNYNELSKRKAAKSGCLKPRCTLSKGTDKILTDLELCLKDQFRRLHIYNPEDLAEEWGGTFSLLDLGSAYENFSDSVRELGATDGNGKWWIYKSDKKLPYTPDNIGLGFKNSIAGIIGETLFVYEGNIISIIEAAEIFDCSEDEIITLQESFISDEDILESLI